MALTQVNIIITHAAQLLTLQAGDIPRRGPAMGELSIIEDGAVAMQGEDIVAVGSTSDILATYQASTVIDATGKVVCPGWIDPHTHIVFAGHREEEFEMRNLGKSYMEIAKAGGGINNTVRQFRAASDEQLLQQSRARLQRFLQGGTTTVEIKSGYGLSLEDELRALRIAGQLHDEQAIDVVRTFLGAHEIPPEYRDKREDYIQLVIEKMIPAVVKENLAEFCDIFCEHGVFEIDDTRRILQAAQQQGMKLKLHADEIESLGGAELAVELQARSADHLMAVSEAGIAALAASDTVAVLLPATSFSLGMTQYAPARKLIDAGAAVALSTDCNPGSSMTESLLFVISLAAVSLHMTAAEAITACTVNAAVAIDRDSSRGRLQPGLLADIIILDIPNYQYLPYHVGLQSIDTVIKRGSIVIQRTSSTA